MPENHAHDEFLELCALAASAQLDESERQSLQKHLAVCPACREAMRQYQAVIDQAMPAVASQEDGDVEVGQTGPTLRQAEQALFERIARDRAPGAGRETAATQESPADRSQTPQFSGEGTWRRIWLLYAAGLVLCIALGIAAYRAGAHRRTSSAPSAGSPPDTTKELALEEQLSDAGHQRELAQAQIENRDHTIADLRLQLQQANAALKLAAAAENRASAQTNQNSTANHVTSEDRAELSQKLSVAQAQVESLQAKLNALNQQSTEDSTRAATLEFEVNRLTQQLQDRDATVDQQQELLAHDRDIRELMGARDLYIAEVYDVNRAGATQKPYGRVFYTKGKSLVFYAYDLDQQPGLKNAKSFQAWGRRGPDTQRAVNLGIFYEDNTAKKRWVLKSDDPQKLAEIDAVFVTVEPNGGSHKPSGQPLLFTYLKVEPNHP